MGEHGKACHVRSSEQIDLTPWIWFEDGGKNWPPPWNNLRDFLMAGFAAKVTEVLRLEFDKEPPRVGFPIMWGDSDGSGGPAVTDPVMMHVYLPLGPSDDSVAYAISLESVVDDFIDCERVADGDAGVITGDDRVKAKQIAERLRQLAGKLERACAEDAT